MRTISTAQQAALDLDDRTTHVRVKIEDPDGTMVDITDHYDQDFFDQITIQADLDNPISVATIVLFRKSGPYSISPLDEDSVINLDSSGSYAPFLNPNRDVTVEVCTVPQGAPADTWVLIWEGIIDEVDWGGRGSKVVLRCRDPMARLNDTFIESVSSYGNDSGTKDIEDVMQDILTAEISSPSITLVFSATSFVVYAYDLGNVSVLDALLALRDLIGWNLTWKWDSSGGDLALVLWEPDRTNTTAAYTFGEDDYFVLPKVALDQEGIRNKGEVVYLTTAGTVASATDTRTSLYSTRFIRIDARGTSVVTATQASDLLSNVLDDLEEPSVQQEVEMPFFWPVELGDLYAFSGNDHYSTEQKWGVFGYRHILNGQTKRTVLAVSGKPSGGYDRWHEREVRRPLPNEPRSRPPSIEVTFNASGQAVVSLSGDESTEAMYVTVGDGSAPNDPTPSSNDGSVTGSSGTVDTGVKVSTSSVGYVRAIAVGYDGRVSSVGSAHYARRIGVVHRDTTTRSHSGSTGKEELESIVIGAGAGIANNETWRLEVFGEVTGTTAAKTVTIDINGSPGNQNLLTFTIPSSYEGDFYVIAGIAGNNSSNAQNTKGRLLMDSTSPLLHKSATTIQSGVGFSIDIDLTITSTDGADVTRTELVAEGTS